MNRFSDITPSVYNPMTFEEIAMVPMMKRKQHDETLAKLELIRSGLANVDPYDKHFDEAIRLKQGLEADMDKTATELSQTGINNDMIGKTIALNRQYQDLVSPTGRLGQINAEKQNILKINEEYDKLGKEKDWGQDRINYWKEKALHDYNATPVYDKNGRVLKYTGPENIANKIDYNKRLDDLATHAGMSTEEFKRGLPIAVGQDSSGYFTQGHQMQGWSRAKNRPQVTEAYNMLIKELNDPTSEVRKSANYEGRNLNSLQDILGTQKEIYMKNSIGNESDYTIDHFGSDPNAKTEEVLGVFGQDYNTNEVGKNSDLSDIENIGKSSKITQPIDPKDTTYNKDFIRKQNQKVGKTMTSNDIKDPKIKALYDKMWKTITTKGVMIDGKLTFLKGDDFKNGKDNGANAAIILKAMQQNPATFTSKLLVTDTDINNSGFGASIGKTADDRDKQIRKELQLSNSGARKLIGPDGKEYSFAQAQDKFNLEGTEGVTYQGYVSPLNWEQDSFNGINSKVSPHVITAKTKDGTYIEFKTSRLNSDNAGINIKRYNDLNKNYHNWSINYDEFVNFESESPSLKGLKVKYNISNPQTDPKRGLLNYEIMDKQGNIHYMTEAEFINSVNATK